MIELKDRIREIRKAANMNQTEFGEALGATRAMITTYEIGKVIPPDPMIELICTKFDVNKAWLMTGEGPMKNPLPEDDGLAEVVDCYENKLPELLKEKVHVLASMDPKWWETLEKALAEAEKIKAGRD